jgi:glucosamine kinase
MIESQDTYLIGVDGGGTGCRVVIADSRVNVLATAEGDPANVTTDFAQTLRNIQKTIGIAAQKAGIDDSGLNNASIHMGLAGVVSHEAAARVAVATGFSHVAVTDDRPTTITGALGGGDGFLISVGTGTIIASSRGGQNRYIGGYGFQVSDQASGAWLGQRLLEETLLSHDGVRPHTDLTRAILANFKGDPNKIVAFGARAKPVDYGLLSPDVTAAAHAGDALGGALMLEGFTYLKAALEVLGFQPTDTLCLTGGVGRHYKGLFAQNGVTNIIEPRGTAVAGALHLAAIAAKQSADVSP